MLYYMALTFNILLATIARPTLVNMLNSLKNELLEDDCLTLVFDGCKEKYTECLSEFKCKINIFEEPVALGFWGHAIRTKYADILEPRTFIMHADDDDTYVEGSFDKLRASCVNPTTLYISKMFGRGNDGIIPRNNVIRAGNIGTPNGIIPYELNKKSSWGNNTFGDGGFYEAIEKQQVSLANEIIFLPDIIYRVN